ncbi:MAG TPA: TIGR00730 family Rossman fold protein [Acidimicrobiales bacterium]|nr:TIGR00730 family Rossman fold protein [Acidimicrobiales bacterium]
MAVPGRYRTGDAELDAAIVELLEKAGIDQHDDLLFEMIVTALRMGRESVGRGDLKLVNAAIKELRYAFRVYNRYRDVHKVTLFGSARTPLDHGAYRAANDFAQEMVERGWMVMTGAGPGIMQAGLEGAGADHSFGVNIVLPFEQAANPVIHGDPKLINFRYFFTRKLTFVKESHGFAVFPGGFGTMDEIFELLTLMQTGKSYLVPVVLIDEQGGDYWHRWAHFIDDELLRDNYISASDMSLVHIAKDVDDAVEHLSRFYRTYHSMRWVGSRLIIRLQRDLTDEELAALNIEFSDISAGDIVRTSVTPSEQEDDDHVELPRVALKFDRSSHARLRQMIDRINGA